LGADQRTPILLYFLTLSPTLPPLLLMVFESLPVPSFYCLGIENFSQIRSFALIFCGGFF